MNYIYIHRNKINGKVYIGQTSLNPKYRWKKGALYKCSVKFYNAITKYGWNSFEHKIICQTESDEEADKLEQELIQKYDSIANGYNLQLGGKLHKKASLETRIKMSNSCSTKKKVMCIEDGVIYNSISAASKDRGIDRAHISAVCLNKRKTAGKLHWQYI